QPHNVLVFRGLAGEPVGFTILVRLDQATPDEISHDPGTLAAQQYLNGTGPLRPGEAATVFRFWMASAGYQDVSAVQSLVFINAVRHYLSTPGLAATFFPVAQPEFWAAMFAYADLTRIPNAD